MSGIFFRSWKLGCKVQITASVDRKRDKMIVNSVHLEHNHELSRDIYMRYPELSLGWRFKYINKPNLRHKYKVYLIQDKYNFLLNPVENNSKRSFSYNNSLRK